MVALDKKYSDQLEALKGAIQSSEHLAKYLDEEEDEFYNALKDEFEPQIEALHVDVASNDPLQLIEIEKLLLDDGLEGLFLPRVLGYSVLRGAVNDNFKYIRPQEHFKNVLIFISNSSNFELLRQRIGKTVEVGFAFSSDIWITNLIAEIANKQVKGFLHDLKDPKYRDIRSRHTAYVKYIKQFLNFNYLTADLPTTAPEVKIEYRSIMNFLTYRATAGETPGASIYDYLTGLVTGDHLHGTSEDLEILMLIACRFDLKTADKKKLAKRIGAYHDEGSEEAFFSILLKLQSSSTGLDDAAYQRLLDVLGDTKMEKMKTFLELIKGVNASGYINPDAIEMARSYYNQNKGLSLENECLRNVMLAKFRAFMSALQPADYNDYFELNKTFIVYMNIFTNEKFNQSIKGLSMSYVKKLLKSFTVKRSKDYQDIKKFVSAVYLDLGFLKEKEIKELFKTKRKRPATSAA